MQDTKLIEILRTFSREEFKELIKFTASPVYSRGRDVLPLLNELKPFFPGFNHKNLNDKYIYSKLYPGKKYDGLRSDSLIKTLTSELFKLCKEFLIYLEMNKDENRKSLYILHQLRERKLYREFEKEYAAIQKRVDISKEIGLNDFIISFYMKIAYAEYCIETGKSQKALDALALSAEDTVIHALIKSYRNSELKTVAKGYNAEYKVNLSEILLKHLDTEKMLAEMESTGHKYYPFAVIYYMTHMMNEHPDEEKYYFKLKELLDKYLNMFNHSEQYVLMGMLAAYCTLKNVNNFNERFTREQFEIYKKSLQLNIYKWSPKDDFQISHFRNMIFTALDLDEIDWLEEFINTYSSEVHPDYRENMRFYSLSHLYFRRGQFEKALEELIKVKYDFFLFKMDVKYLMFKIYYEMDYYEQALSVLSTISQYISSTKDLSAAFKERGNSYVKFTRELVKRKLDNNIQDIGLFEKEVRSAKSVNSLNWILLKISELKAGK